MGNSSPLKMFSYVCFSLRCSVVKSFTTWRAHSATLHSHTKHPAMGSLITKNQCNKKNCRLIEILDSMRKLNEVKDILENCIHGKF